MTDLELSVDVRAATLPDVLREYAARDPDAVAFTHLTFDASAGSDGRGVGHDLTRGRYHRRSTAVAAALAAHVRPGARVLVLLSPGLEMAVGVTGVLYAGGVAAPCSPPPEDVTDPRSERVVQIARQVDVGAVVATADTAARLTDLRAKLGDLPWVAVDTVDDADGYEPPSLTGDDPALLQFSPGPTGAGRGIVVSHTNLLAQIDQTVRLAHLPAGANVVGWVSPYHALGIAGHLLLSQYLGGRHVSLAPEDFVADPLRWLRAISDTPGPVFSCAPNFAFDRCVDRIPAERRAGLDLSGWQTAFNAAERVQPHTVERFVDAFAPHGFAAATMAPGYGMSETMLFLTGRHPGTDPLVLTVDPAELGRGRVARVDATDGLSLVGLGATGPHCELLLVDPETRTPVDADRVGEVWVRGPVVCQGYHDRPELTAETFGGTLADGTGPYLRTGDLGFRHDGELVLSGRCKELAIIRGRNLFPEDVEATCRRVRPALADMPGAAFSVDSDEGERLVVVQSVPADDDGEDLDALAARLRAAVTGEHEVEVHDLLVVAPDQVPRRPDGTVHRDATRQRYLADELVARATSRRNTTPAAAESFGPLRGMLLALDEALRVPVLVAELRRRLATVLGTTAEKVAEDTALAGLGVESVRAIELRGDLERDLGVAVPMVEFLRGSLTSLATAVAGQLDGPAKGGHIDWRPLVADPGHRHEPFPLTEQQYAYFAGRSAEFNLGGVSVHIYIEVDAADLDVDRLSDALRRLVAHQEMLRTMVCADGTQRILPVDETVLPDIPVTDLSGATDAARDEHLAGVRDELSHQVLPIDHWPMFEVRASRLADGVTRVHVSLDLLIADVASVRLFFLEWGDFYHDPQAHPTEPAVSFRDYVLALDQVQESPAYQRSREYWLARIADLPPGPELPVASGEERGSRTRRAHVLDATRWSRLRGWAADRGVTPTVVQLAAFSEVLGRWSRRARFSINVPLFNRMPLHPQIDTIIGDFTAVTLLEVDLTRADGIGALAETIQRQLWQDLDHRYFTGVEVMRELSRQTGVPPGLFTSVVFASAREHGRDREGDQGSLGSAWLGEMGYVVSQTPQVLFDHQVYEDRGTLSFNWDVVEGVFPDQVLDDMFGTYCRLLEQLADDEAAWEPGALDTLPATQRELVAAANDTAGPVPTGLLHEPLVGWALREPDRVAVQGRDATLSYGELYRRACVLAGRLVELGVQRNELVAVAVDKSAAQIVAALGVVLAGAAYLPVDPDLPGPRQDHLATVGRCRAVLTRAGGPRRDWPDPLTELVMDLAEPVPAEVPAPTVSATPDDLAYVIFTSGSTGTPKGVMLRHSAAANTMVDINERYSVGPDDAVLGLSSLSFDLSVYDVFGVLGAGGRLVLPRHGSNRDPGHWVDLVAEHGVTVWNSVPALAQMLVEQAESAGSAGGLDPLRVVLMSGDWLPVDLPDRLRALAPNCRPVSLGGATEAAVWSIAYDIGDVDPAWESIPYGRALRNQSFHVFNDRWSECPAWVTGELFIGGVGLADGYWADEEKTTARFVTHPVTGERLYRTGDLGRWRSDGLIEFLGREDGQVKIGGYRIELGEIEAAL
ncbi:MAG: amino acid adenylation domain-containing protein, partial [Actinocatenispora sp.]